MTSTGGTVWDGAAYVEGSAHHRAYDDVILAPLDLTAGMRVLDVGCGTGELTATVAALVAPGEVVGLEPDASQVHMALRHRTFRVVQGRAQDLADLVEGCFDVVLSVAVMQWIGMADHLDILQQMAQKLRPGGQLRLDMGGHGQIADVRAVLDPIAEAHGGKAPWTFPTVEDYALLLASAGFDTGDGGLRLVRQQRAFADEQAFSVWLRSQIINGYSSRMPAARRETFAALAEAAALADLRLSDGSFDQTYTRLDVHAVRT